MKYIYDKTSPLPGETHYAALVFTTVHIPGDERSRTHPGHGYPANDKPIVQYIAFADEDEMKQWVIDSVKKNISFDIIQSTPMETELRSVVSVKTKSVTTAPYQYK